MTRVAHSPVGDTRLVTVAELDAAPIDSWIVFAFGTSQKTKATYRKTDRGWLNDHDVDLPLSAVPASILATWGAARIADFRWSLHHPGLIRTAFGDGTHDWFCRVCDDNLGGFESVEDARVDGRAHLAIHAEDTADITLDQLPADHPIRREHARLTVALTLTEGRIATTLDHLDREAWTWPRSSAAGQLIEAVGCRLTGRNGSWKAGDR